MFMIIIRGLNKAFGDKIIFSNFNLEIPDGSFVVISGDSGSGKSTLLNMIGGSKSRIAAVSNRRAEYYPAFFADTVEFFSEFCTA